MSFSLSTNEKKNDKTNFGKNSFLGGEPRRTLSLCNEAQSVVVVVVVVVVLDARHIVILSKKGCPPGKGKSRLKKNELFSTSPREGAKVFFMLFLFFCCVSQTKQSVPLSSPWCSFFLSLSEEALLWEDLILCVRVCVYKNVPILSLFNSEEKARVDKKKWWWVSKQKTNKKFRMIKKGKQKAFLHSLYVHFFPSVVFTKNILLFVVVVIERQKHR